MDRHHYIARIEALVAATLRARNAAAHAYWSGGGTMRTLRRAQGQHVAACVRWNTMVRADMRRRPQGSRATRAVAPESRALP